MTIVSVVAACAAKTGSLGSSSPGSPTATLASSSTAAGSVIETVTPEATNPGSPTASQDDEPGAPSGPPAATPRPTRSPTPALPTNQAPRPGLRPGLLAVTVTDGLRARSRPGTGAGSVKYEPLLSIGTKLRILEGPVAASGFWWYRVEAAGMGADLVRGTDNAWVAASDHDGEAWVGPAPETCADFEFPDRAISAGSFAELKAGMTGDWAGCVTTPWVPAYWVWITLRDDGSYSARSQTNQAGPAQPAFYYGSDEDSPEKRYALNDFQDSLKGVGQIDIWFNKGNTNRGELRNIKLMGDQIEFEFFHRGEYGPLTYRLFLVSSAS